jgi:hypothetical protein
VEQAVIGNVRIHQQIDGHRRNGKAQLALFLHHILRMEEEIEHKDNQKVQKIVLNEVRHHTKLLSVSCGVYGCLCQFYSKKL